MCAKGRTGGYRRADIVFQTIIHEDERVKLNNKGYDVVRFPMERMLIVDSMRIANRKRVIQGLLEVDVTKARTYMREHKMRTGETLSFTAFILTCLGRAVDEHKIVHAYRDRRHRLVIFDEVDVTTMIEVELGDQKFPYAHIVRAANTRDFRGLHDEIRAVQSGQGIRESQDRWGFMRWFLLLPTFLRDLAYHFWLGNPHLVKSTIGTVGLTAVGMFGEGGGWGLYIPIYTVGVMVGGISLKPWVVDGRIEIREILNLTVGFDHDIVDGAPAARFTKRLKELIEVGPELIESADQ